MPSGRLRDNPALAVILTCWSPVSCAHPGYSSLPSGAWRPKKCVPSCSSPHSGREELLSWAKGTEWLKGNSCAMLEVPQVGLHSIGSIPLGHLPPIHVVSGRGWSPFSHCLLSHPRGDLSLVLWRAHLPPVTLAQRQGGSPHSSPALARKQRLDTD